jgi:hypothetical protein
MLIPVEAFEARAAHAKEKTRYALNGVLIRRDSDGRPWIVSTNGRWLARATWDEPDPEEYPEGPDPVVHGKEEFQVLLSPKAMADAPKLRGTGNRYKPILGYVLLDENREDPNKPVRMMATDLETWNTAHHRQVEGKFPPHEEVIPKYDDDNSTTITLSIKYLHSISAMLKKLSNGENEIGASVKITVPHDTSCAVLFRHKPTDGVETEAVLMPVNLETDVETTPTPEPEPATVSPDLSKEPELAEAIAPPDNGTPVPPPPGIDEGMKRIRETEPEKKSKPSAMPPCTACKKTLTNHPSGLCHPCGTKSGERNGPAPVPCTTEGCKRKSLHSSGLCKKCRKAAGVTNGKPAVEPTKEPVSEPINDGWSPWFDLTVHALPAEYAEKTDLYQIQPGGSGVQWRRRL